MSSHEPDDVAGPDPERIPGLEPGGSVPPGETPPDAASATEGLAPRERASAHRTTWTWLTVIVVVVLLVAALFVALAVGYVP